MPNLISYAPGKAPGVTMINSDVTIGPTQSVGRSGGLPATVGTIPNPNSSSYPAYNLIGRSADAGEICDCLNQLVTRIEALEAIIANNPAYGITQT